MSRRPNKSHESGLFKSCQHLWDRCDCPWLGRYKRVRYINLAEWAAVPPPINKTRAKVELGEMKAAINGGTFRKEGKTFSPLVLETAMTLSKFIERYRSYLTDE